MAEESDATTRQQVLDLIVEKGPVTASSIAKVLGLTTAAVRRHITLLLDSKEIAEHEPGAPSKRGRGRPARRCPRLTFEAWPWTPRASLRRYGTGARSPR